MPVGLGLMFVSRFSGSVFSLGVSGLGIVTRETGSASNFTYKK